MIVMIMCMKARLDLQKLDLDRQLEQAAAYKREAIEEMSRQRSRMKKEFSEERYGPLFILSYDPLNKRIRPALDRQHLDRLRLEYTEHEARLNMKAAEQNAYAESMLAEAKRLQAEVTETTNRFRREETEFSVRHKMLDPILAAAAQDREAAEAIKREAQTNLEIVEAREAALLESEAGLRARERNAEKKAADARIVYNKYFNTKSHTEADIRAIGQQKNGILKERFRLHRCSVELSSQMDMLKHAVREVMKLKMSSCGHSRTRPLPLTNARRDIGDENIMNMRNDDGDIDEGQGSYDAIDHSSAPMLIHCKSLLSKFEDASERMLILSEELQSDPFHTTPSQDNIEHQQEAFDHTMQLPVFEDSRLDVQRAKDRHPCNHGNPPDGFLLTYRSKRGSFNDPEYQALEQSGPLETKTYVANADASLAALKAAAANYCK